MKKFVRRFIAIFTAMTIAAVMMVTNVSAYYSVMTENGIQTVKGTWSVYRRRSTQSTYLSKYNMTDFVCHELNPEITTNKSILQVSCTYYSSNVSSEQGAAYAKYVAFIHNKGYENIPDTYIVTGREFYAKRSNDTYYLPTQIKPGKNGLTITFTLENYNSSTVADISGNYKLL